MNDQLTDAVARRKQLTDMIDSLTQQIEAAQYRIATLKANKQALVQARQALTSAIKTEAAAL